MTSRRWATGGVLALGLILSVFSSAQEKLFTPEQMRADIAFIMQTFEDVHPNIYAYQDKASASYRREALERRLTYPLSAHAFRDSLEPFLNSFQDDHTSIPAVGETLQGAIAEASVSPNSYAFSIPKANAALLEIRAMENLERFQSLLNDAFTRIQSQKIKNLIVDLRFDHGGNGTLGNALLDYVTNQPYRQFSRVEFKVSAQMTAYRTEHAMGLPWTANTPIGSIYKAESSFAQPSPNSLRFDGKVYVLISRETASSGKSLASAFKDFKLGTLVGEETDEPATSHGEIYPFKLPNSGLEVQTSSMYWVRPSGLDDGRGVLPDVNVPSAQALDWVLEQVK